FLPALRGGPDPSGGGPPTLPAPGRPAQGAPAQPLRVTRNVPGDSKPLILDADEIVTWGGQGQRLIVARGNVLLQQNVVQLRSREVVLFVDVDRMQRTGILHADVYAEGEVQLQEGHNLGKGAQAWLDLNTRGELRLNAPK